MARLFITPREIDFISDLTKEVNKDIRGQKIFYYKVRADLTNVHEVYEEAPNKVFDPPVEIDCSVEWAPQEVRTNRFGTEEHYNISAFLHYRDLIDREIDVEEGDYFSYGETFFEITQVIYQNTIYGQVEYKTGVKLVATQARIGQIDKTPIGPTDEGYSDPDAVQKTFVQQRGFAENAEGPTGDSRALIEQGKTELPPKPAPAQVSPDGISSSFYDES